MVASSQSTGSVTARRYSHDGWQAGEVTLAIDNGELDVTADAGGQLAASRLSINLEPIDIPESVFGKPAQMTNVRLSLADTPHCSTTWRDADDADASAIVRFDLDWSLSVNGSGTPLGTQHLSAIPLDVMLTGAGDHVDATIAVHATGEVWSWADLFQLTALSLQLDASTAT